MKLLFLDVDGVLNSTKFSYELATDKLEKYKSLSFPLDSFDYRAIELVNYILDNTDAKLGISSDWRFDDELEPCLLYHGLKHKIYGRTPYDKHYRRNIEIETFISKENENIESYCIIDDIDNWFNDEQLKHMVKTSTFEGLTKKLADKAIKILNNEQE